MSALITACNEALALIMKDEITSLDEGSIEARYCNLFAQPLLEEVADWCAWPNLIKRTSLAEVTNDRAAEWLYAYQMPADYGEFIAIRKVEEDAQMLPDLSPPFTLPVQDRFNYAAKVEGGKVYTNVESAILVYSASKMTVSDMTPKVRRAFVLELAARLAAPVGKMSARDIASMMNNALMAREEGIADAMNKNPQIEPTYASSAELARAGLLE